MDTMQENCEKLKLPFEVLLQGSNKNRLVRSLMYATPNVNTDICPNENVRNERNTISIYKPAITENKIQKREIREYEEAKNNDLIDAKTNLSQDDADWMNKPAQCETGLVGQEADDAIQQALANSEDTHYYSHGGDSESEKTLKELEEFLAQLGIYIDDDDRQTGKRNGINFIL